MKRYLVEVDYGTEVEFEEFDSRTEAEEFADGFYWGTEVKIHKMW